ncbi:MAG: DUF885 family protein, partial [Planctomycetes bacterium]|nr:DUF885 family protein [Planctomycetota bacterium]
MKTLAPLLLCLLPLASQEGRPASPPLPDAKEQLALGLAVSFEGGGLQDVRDARLAALYVPEGTPPSPFLSPGPFKATWEGFVSVDLGTDVSFSAVGNGSITVTAADKPALTAKGDLSTVEGPSLRLRKGRNKLVVKYESPAKGDAFVRLYWASSDFTREPVPPLVLSHNVNATPVRTQRRIREGRELVAMRRCLKCHTGDFKGMPELEMDAPSLAEAGARLHPDWIARWILNPRELRPEATMPRLPGVQPQDAADMAAYLATLGKPEPNPAAPADASKLGGHLFAEMRCIGCHTLPDREPAPDRIPFSFVKAKWKPAALKKFLLGPESHYTWIEMPNFRLKDEEAGKGGRLQGRRFRLQPGPERGGRRLRGHRSRLPRPGGPARVRWAAVPRAALLRLPPAGRPAGRLGRSRVRDPGAGAAQEGRRRRVRGDRAGGALVPLAHLDRRKAQARVGGRVPEGGDRRAAPPLPEEPADALVPVARRTPGPGAVARTRLPGLERARARAEPRDVRPGTQALRSLGRARLPVLPRDRPQGRDQGLRGARAELQAVEGASPEGLLRPLGPRAAPPRAGDEDAAVHQGRPDAAHGDPGGRRREAGRRPLAVPARGRPDPPPGMSPSRELQVLCDDSWEATLRENPTYATYLGDFRFNDRLADISEAGRSRRRAQYESFLSRVRALDLASLGENDRVSADILRLQLEQSIEEDRHKFWQWDVDQMGGPQADFPQIVNFHPLTDLAGLEARYRAFSAWMDQYLDNLRAGVREGRVAMHVAVERVIGQLKGLLGTPEEKSPLAAKPELVPAIRDSVYPAYRRMLKYLEEEYLPSSRTKDVGLWALPGGREAYAFRIRLHTTTDLSAEEIHRIGLQELKSIQNEMRTIAKGELKPFMERIRKDPGNFFASREELLASARRELAKANAKLPAWFKRLPKNECEVKPIEEYRERDCVAAFYYPPDEKLTRKGIFYANTFEAASRPKFNLPALAIHEAVPGHHLQIALALEIESLPRFRRQAGFTAYVEGWGLYSERLGDEMGLYEDDLSR